MIPEFPQFKNLDWGDRTEFESYSSWLAPHSDFNFVSVWAWDVNETMKLSKLNGNIVILFNDYNTGEHYLSFVGKNKITETALELINFSSTNYGVSILKYVPEEIADDIESSQLGVLVDESNCDYILRVSDFAESDTLTRKHGRVGKICRAFLRLYPSIQLKVCSINDADKTELRELFTTWAGNKQLDTANLVEYKAFERYLQLTEEKIKVVSIYIDNIVIGFQTIEILSKGFATVDFAKADVNYKGIFQMLDWKTCEYLKKEGVVYLNIQVDLGCKGLRVAKITKNRPAFFLKRFIVQGSIAQSGGCNRSGKGMSGSLLGLGKIKSKGIIERTAVPPFRYSYGVALV